MCAERDGGGRGADAGVDLERVLAEVNGRIASHVAANGSWHAFGTYVDPTLRRVVVETDAPADIVDAVLAEHRTSRRVVVRRTRISDAP